ncbi:hypothetical protein C8R44DRAFT_750512 [Mycena epipterygia]|nr:hypothetical protein C8R44DRAFT_750512 [Mycena epipterygia]
MSILHPDADYRSTPPPPFGQVPPTAVAPDSTTSHAALLDLVDDKDRGHGRYREARSFIISYLPHGSISYSRYRSFNTMALLMEQRTVAQETRDSLMQSKDKTAERFAALCEIIDTYQSSLEKCIEANVRLIQELGELEVVLSCILRKLGATDAGTRSIRMSDVFTVGTALVDGATSPRHPRETYEAFALRAFASVNGLVSLPAFCRRWNPTTFPNRNYKSRLTAFFLSSLTSTTSDQGASLESFTRSKYHGANDGDLDLDPARAQKSKLGAQIALRGKGRSGGENTRGRSKNGGSAGMYQMRPNSTFAESLIHLHYKLNGAWIVPKPCEFCGVSHQEKFDYEWCGGKKGIVKVVEYYLRRLNWPIRSTRMKAVKCKSQRAQLSNWVSLGYTFKMSAMPHSLLAQVSNSTRSSLYLVLWLTLYADIYYTADTRNEANREIVMSSWIRGARDLSFNALSITPEISATCTLVGTEEQLPAAAVLAVAPLPRMAANPQKRIAKFPDLCLEAQTYQKYIALGLDWTLHEDLNVPICCHKWGCHICTAYIDHLQEARREDGVRPLCATKPLPLPVVELSDSEPDHEKPSNTQKQTKKPSNVQKRSKDRDSDSDDDSTDDIPPLGDSQMDILFRLQDARGATRIAGWIDTEQQTTHEQGAFTALKLVQEQSEVKKDKALTREAATSARLGDLVARNRETEICHPHLRPRSSFCRTRTHASRIGTAHG